MRVEVLLMGNWEKFDGFHSSGVPEFHHKSAKFIEDDEDTKSSELTLFRRNKGVH